MKRIRYVKGPMHGEWTSMQVMQSNVGEVKSRLFHGGKTGAVLSASDETAISTVTGTSPHAVKIKLKLILIQLGVVFDDEERDRNAEGIQEHIDASQGTDPLKIT